MTSPPPPSLHSYIFYAQITETHLRHDSETLAILNIGAVADQAFEGGGLDLAVECPHDLAGVRVEGCHGHLVSEFQDDGALVETDGHLGQEKGKKKGYLCQ